MTRPVTAAALIAGALLLTSCAAGEPATQAPAPGTASSTTEPPAHDHGTDDLPEPTPIPTTLPSGARSPADLTVVVLTAFSRRDLGPEEWRGQLAPYLTDNARDAYAYVDPAEVPFSQIVGAPNVLPQTSDYLVEVQEETDAGMYTVLFIRGEDGAWLVESINAPESAPLGS